MIFLFALLIKSVFAGDVTYIRHQEILRRFDAKIFTANQKPLFHPMMPMEQKPGGGRTQIGQIPRDVTPVVDLRYRDTPAKRQFGSTCSTFGLIASLENALFEKTTVDLSERHLWSKYHKYSSKHAIQAALQKGAITDENYWPERSWIPKHGYKKNAKARLMEAEYIASKVYLAIEALDKQRPVYLGLSVTDSLYACHQVVDPNSPPNGGGHAVSVVGYGLDETVSGGGYFIIKNSWSIDCGDHGYQYVPFNYCTRDDMYCIMWDIKDVRSTAKSE